MNFIYILNQSTCHNYK